MKVITAEWLEEQKGDICSRQLKRFKQQLSKWKRLFPNDMRLMLKNIQFCADNNLDIDWLADTMLKDKGWITYWEMTQDKYFDLPAKARDDRTGKSYRKFLQHCIRPLWEAIKLDRKSK
jgi:hypothetical protein